MSYPHKKKYRYYGMPKDSFHVAVASHRARLGNSLRAAELSVTEKGLLKQRIENLKSAKAAYHAKQKTSLFMDA
jgi:hypothetical protein